MLRYNLWLQLNEQQLLGKAPGNSGAQGAENEAAAHRGSNEGWSRLVLHLAGWQPAGCVKPLLFST